VPVPEATEKANRLIDLYRQNSKRWQNRTASQGHTLVENYRAGRLTIVCNLDIAVTHRDGGTANTALDDQPVRDSKVLASLIFCANLSDKVKAHISKQEHVLINDVELMELPEEIPIPSLVRLYDIQVESKDWRSGLLFQSTIDGSGKFLPGFIDWEFAVLVSLFLSDSVEGVIKSGAEVVEGIADNGHQVVWHGLCRFELDRIISAIRIMINPYNVRATIAQCSESRVKIIDMLIGPL
jgi:hypothetical protein